MRLGQKSILLLIVISGIFYKSPPNLSYWWNFGFLSLFFLLFQVVRFLVYFNIYTKNKIIR